MTFPLNYGLSKTGLPLIVANIFEQNICLMLDTGSNRNIIDYRIYDHFTCAAPFGLPQGKQSASKDRLTFSETSDEVITLNGATTGTTIDVPFNFENQDYHEPFLCTEMTDAFDKIHEESGIQIHGILGNHFFLKHGWVLDFEKITLYAA